MNTPTTAAQYLASAAAHDQAAEASFQRSDTDGFATQWAHGICGQRDRLAAEIAAADGKAHFRALFDLAGDLVPAKYIKTRYGYAWALLASDDPGSRFVGFFNESTAEDPSRARKANAKKGYYIGRILASARAEIQGYGHGFSGHAWAATQRTDGGFSRDVVILDNGITNGTDSAALAWFASNPYEQPGR